MARPVYCLLLSLLWPALSRSQDLFRFAFRHEQMGTEFNILLYATDKKTAEDASMAAFRRIDELNGRLSDYLEDSELSRLSHIGGRDSAAPVSDDLWAVLQAAQELSHNSDGAFDLTVGPLTKLWRRAFRQQEFPGEPRLAEARALTGYRMMKLLPRSHAVRLLKEGMRLDAGGIAKGYAVDEAMEVLRARGITRAVVDGGGDLLVSGAPPGQPGWRVHAPGIDSLGRSADTVLVLAGLAVATSGDTYRYLEWNGKRYSHLIDPRSGLGLTHRALVSVSCPTCILADGLATALSVIGPQGNWQRLFRRYKGCSARMVFPDDSGRWTSETRSLFKSRNQRKHE